MFKEVTQEAEKLHFCPDFFSRDMDTCNKDKDKNELQDENSWIPNTPKPSFKTILPNPQLIHPNRQENQIDHPKIKISPDFSSSTGNCNWEVALNPLNGKGNATVRTCSFDGWSFSSLLAYHDRGSAASSSGESQKNEDSLRASNHHNSNYTQNSQYDLPIPHGLSYDLNLPAGGTAVKFSYQTTSHIAPITPQKSTRVECGLVDQMQCFSTVETVNKESNEPDSEVETNGLQKSKKDASFSAACTMIEEHHSPDKEGTHVINFCETPEQKPRRKKHRPKVFIEGKPRPQKPVTPKNVPSAENPTGKRKYVRKIPLSNTPTTIPFPSESTEKPTGKRKYVRRKPLDKISTPPLEATRESTDSKTLDPSNKSCKRSLNFDTEGQPGDNNSKCKPNSNEDSQQQAHNDGGGNQSTSTVTLGHGIEVIVETTKTGIPHDLNCTVHQMLQDYKSLPVKQAPSTNTCSAPRKQNDQESYAKGEDQVTAHNAHQNTAQIMQRTGIQLLQANANNSNYSTYMPLIKEGQADSSNRELLSFTQQPGTCNINLPGIRYTAIPQYQEHWVQFPSICKKRRTEKANDATTSSTSCLTTANCKKRPDITGPQNNIIGGPPASIVNCLIPAPHSNTDRIPGAFGETGDLQYKIGTSDLILVQTERSTKKRSRGLTRTRDLASLTKIARGAMHQNYTARQAPVDYHLQQAGDSSGPHACMVALVAEMRRTLTTKKRTKKTFLVSSASSSTNVERTQKKIILYNQNQLSANSFGSPEVIWKQKTSIDTIAENLDHLDISKEGSSSSYVEQNAIVPYGIGNEQQNALVLYRSDGTIIPFTGSPIKKRRPRPKVDLDEETNKVWKLLMGNINNEGVDGTEEDKVRWWEDERNVFSGRANSFIARMHLVQGDRRFSPWKGSVVDSVVGVFLTQNVSDHLSSSAFMSLAAHFPLRSQSKDKPCYEERAGSLIDKPIVCMPDQEDAIKWNEEMSNQSICDQTSMTLHDSEIDEEREVAYSNESSTSSTGIVSSSGIEAYYESTENRSTTEVIKIIDTCDVGEKTRANDAVSSQYSVVSSQNSVDSPSAQTAERKEAFSENNSEAGDAIYESKYNSPASFMELLRRAGSNQLNEVHSNSNGIVLSDQNSNDECNKNQNVANEKTCHANTSKSSLEAPTTPSNYHHLHLSSNKMMIAQMITEDTRCSSKTSSRNSMKEPSSFTEESASQITEENNLTMTTEALRFATANNPPFHMIQEEKHVIIQTQNKEPQKRNKETQQELYLPNFSEETPDTMESSSALNKPEKDLQKMTESGIIEHSFSETKELDGMNAATRKAKGRRVGKEIRDNVDWDALRKEAEACGKKRERTPNTMDSLDWEAVRCADVGEIANTIKERGMNNMLAERIKNFLNRIVREHGSIDLEWLRDVPPDKAKEYLLSIRGLGLKSVECVRLLTLHHVAFPVDTNVGRIAVRLGWVPLQPLPESLQLHLLELYPVLESIQKYLWPRLCKLDQRTLYELHYQMITFGKVFCTKSKPNCNACPMRGECRHFASAFASARLALPGPEEKGIVSATENRTNEPNPEFMVNQTLLPLPQATQKSEKNQLSKLNQKSEARHGIHSCEPIIEVPSSPEPECIQVPENDMEDAFCEDPDEIPTIKLNLEEFTQNLQSYMQNNMEIQECDMSKALVALTAAAASIPTPKLKNVSRLRTEHQVYELPDSHPLLQGLDKREPDDPCSYLLAIWTPGETANSIQPPESSCKSQEYGELCDERTCFSCNSIREANSQIVRGTLLIPCRTAMRGSFPLNGTYFQVNEVFADHDSSLNPIDVPRSWIWNLPRRTVYFGTSIPTIFKGLTTEGIQHCFWRGFVCVRGFDQKTRAPRPLMARLHFPASKLNKGKGRDSNE